MLRLFGPTRVSGGSGPRLPRAAFLAVALLDLAPSRVMTREALAARLWEGAPAVRANASLRQLVARIRSWEQGDGRAVLKVTPFTIGRDDSTFASDLSQFLAIESVDSAAGLRLICRTLRRRLPRRRRRRLGTHRPMDRRTARLAARPLRQARARGSGARRRASGPAGAAPPRRRSALRRRGRSRRAWSRRGSDPLEVRAIYDRYAARLRADLGNEPETKTQALLRELTNETPVAARLRVDEPSPAVTASVDSVPRVLILPPGESPLPVARPQARRSADRRGHPHAGAPSHLCGLRAAHRAAARQVAVPGRQPLWRRLSRHYALCPRRRRPAPVRRADPPRDARTAADRRTALHARRPQRPSFPSRCGHRHAPCERHRAHRTPHLPHHRVGLGLRALSARLRGLRSIDLRAVRRAKAHFRQALKLSRDFVAPRAMMARAISVEWLLLDRNERARIDKAIALRARGDRARPDGPQGPPRDRSCPDLRGRDR